LTVNADTNTSIAGNVTERRQEKSKNKAAPVPDASSGQDHRVPAVRPNGGGRTAAAAAAAEAPEAGGASGDTSVVVWTQEDTDNSR